MNYLGLASGQPEGFFPGFVDSGMTFQDKRNRNPNWTDHEIVRFLEMLQEDQTVKDLIANRNKKVFCNIAQRMCDEGAGKSWDQCRIKLKNLKSQYRYVKERIPNIDSLDLEDDNVVRQLISECQGRGISPSSIKHLRFLLRFLNKQKQFAKTAGQTHDSSLLLLNSNSNVSDNGATSNILNKSKDEAVSPPSSPFPGLKILPDSAAAKKAAKSDDEQDEVVAGVGANGGMGSLTETGYQFLEQFNRDMMDQFMEHQRRTQASFARWEQERWRQERESLEKWRQEAREHERQLFGMFCTAMTKCNAAITTVLKAKAVAAAVSSNAGKRGASVAKRAADDEGSPTPTGNKRRRQDSALAEQNEEADDDDDDDEVDAAGVEDDDDVGDEDDIHNIVQVTMDAEDTD